MARRTKQITASAAQPDWFLPEWMGSLRVTQAKLAADCDWSRGTMHGIYHGRTSYYRELVNLVASKLNIEPFELLMHPDEAMALRRIRKGAVGLAEISQIIAAPIDEVRTGTEG